MAAGSKVWVCGLYLAENVGSNPTRDMDVLFVVTVVLSCRGLCEELITRPEDS